MKILDRYLVLDFIPPFILASLVALFVIVMQSLWVYMDEIMGKGVEFFVIVEMIFYMSMSFVPLALPVGILISSVLNFGNLAEKYELASMKSAGISLMRIMMPLIIFSVFIGIFSFITSNNIIPYSNLKFMTRLSDISRQKPALNLETNVFNYDFSGYAIRIKDKDSETNELEDVMIYDHSDARLGTVTILTAERGKMYTGKNEKYLIMDLYDGYQYQETAGKKGNAHEPVVRTSFGKLTKVFDMSEFDLARSDEERYKTREQMLNVSQLSDAIDSLDKKLEEISFDNVKNVELLEYKASKKSEKSRRSKKGKAQSKKHNKITQVDSLASDIDVSFLYTFSENARSKILQRASTNINYQSNFTTGNVNSYNVTRIRKNRHLYQMHFKFMLAAICVIFLFIGAPMGAIVRKGGYGYPMLVAILFFMIFILLNNLGKDMVRRDTIDPIFAAWMPNIILFPIGLFLTYKARNDSKIVDIGLIVDFVVYWWNKIRGKGHLNSGEQ